MREALPLTHDEQPGDAEVGGAAERIPSTDPGAESDLVGAQEATGPAQPGERSVDKRRHVDPAVHSDGRSLDQDELSQVVATALTAFRQTVSWSAPLPDPHTLQQYNEVVPGAADRIIRMAESDTSERASVEAQLAQGEVEAAKLGISMAFLLAVICVVAAIVFFALGKTIAGSVMLGLPAVTMIGTFITRGQKSDSK